MPGLREVFEAGFMANVMAKLNLKQASTVLAEEGVVQEGSPKRPEWHSGPMWRGR